ncbi:hypothetical protein [Pseudomonas aeruginosa]|uniref:hypothetical protein n=1 Tax=Pseudomonas aeruginosa TaxID=287 RepID=UPI00070D4606|nr:hypothetical protein [Pseudomonas aeruginosa]
MHTPDLACPECRSDNIHLSGSSFEPDGFDDRMAAICGDCHHKDQAAAFVAKAATAPSDPARQLLSQLELSGWKSYEVMQDGAWVSTPSIDSVIVAIQNTAKPVLRLIKNGSQTAVVMLAAKDSGKVVEDHTNSFGFAEAIAQALADL